MGADCSIAAAGAGSPEIVAVSAPSGPMEGAEAHTQPPDHHHGEEQTPEEEPSAGPPAHGGEDIRVDDGVVDAADGLQEDQSRDGPERGGKIHHPGELSLYSPREGGTASAKMRSAGAITRVLPISDAMRMVS